MPSASFRFPMWLCRGYGGKLEISATPRANQDFDKVMTLSLDKLVEKNVTFDDH